MENKPVNIFSKILETVTDIARDRNEEIKVLRKIIESVYEYKMFEQMVGTNMIREANYLIDHNIARYVTRDAVKIMLQTNNLKLFEKCVEHKLISENTKYDFRNNEGQEATWFNAVGYYEAYHERLPPEEFIHFLEEHNFDIISNHSEWMLNATPSGVMTH